MKIDLSTILEMVEEEDKKIKENKAPVQPKQEEATLDLQGLFSLFEELEPSINERLSGTAAKTILAQDEEILKFIVPKVVYTERGIEGNKEMVELARSKLNSPTPLGRLQELSRHLNIGKTTGRVKGNTNDFRGMINRMAVIDGFKSVFTSFEATTAGTVTEQVIASLFNEGERQDTKQSTDEGYVTDVKIGKQAYAIKTIAPGGSREMSAWNFVNTLDEEKERGIVLLDIVKEEVGKESLILKVVEDVVKLGDGHDKVRVTLKKDVMFAIYSKSEKKPIENTLQALISAKQKPQFYYTYEKTKDGIKEIPLADAIQKATNKDSGKTARVAGFTSYVVKHLPLDPVTIEFNTTSKQIRNEILLLTQQVRDSIISLKNALEVIAKGMSQFFVAENQNEVRGQILDAADLVKPKAVEATKEE